MFFAPAQVGGGTSYAIIVGNSMEPKLHRGDLAVVRKRSTYRAGDVVLYDSRELGSKVLHRIVRVENGRFVLKGDNNSFLDSERIRRRTRSSATSGRPRPPSAASPNGCASRCTARSSSGW